MDKEKDANEASILSKYNLEYPSPAACGIGRSMPGEAWSGRHRAESSPP
jgi:hypothetical protein